MERQESKQKLLKILPFVILALLILAGSIWSLFNDPEAIIESIGVRNGYIALLIVALTAGVSLFTTSAYYAFLVSLAAAGLEPVFIGLVGALGITIGDAVFYRLGEHGRESENRFLQNAEEALVGIVSKIPKWGVPVFAFFYTGLGPLPNDVLMISAALANVKFRYLVLPVFLGNATFGFLLASGAHFLF